MNKITWFGLLRETTNLVLNLRMPRYKGKIWTQQSSCQPRVCGATFWALECWKELNFLFGNLVIKNNKQEAFITKRKSYVTRTRGPTNDDNKCPRCGIRVETNFHCIFFCHHIKHLWFASPLGFMPNLWENEEFSLCA